MKYGRYRNTSIVSYQIADNIDSLLQANFLTIDVELAARCAPLFFNPRSDNALFAHDRWWDTPLEDKLTAAAIVTQKFDAWYPRASALEKGYLTLIGLCDSYEYIDGIVDTVIETLSANHRLTYVDADETSFEVSDYHAVRDAANIARVLDENEMVRIWSGNFAKQVNRIADAPAVSIEGISKWSEESHDFQDKISEYFHRNIYGRTGISVKRARKIINRSYRLAELFFGREQTRSMARGDEIRIHAHHLVWGLKLQSNRLIESSIDPSNFHTPFVITLYDHDGNKLCHGCILWPGTPALDQAVGFILSTSSPEEELALLKDINLSRWTQAGFGCEILKSKRRPDQDQDEDEFGDYIDLNDRVIGNVIEVEAPETIRTVPFFLPEIAEPTPNEHDEPDEPEPEEPRLSSTLDSNDDDTIYGLNHDGQMVEFYRPPTFYRRHWRTLRREDSQVHRIEQMLFDKIDAPRALLEFMVNPEKRTWWGRQVQTDFVPERIGRYITEKRLP